MSPVAGVGQVSGWSNPSIPASELEVLDPEKVSGQNWHNITVHHTPTGYRITIGGCATRLRALEVAIEHLEATLVQEGYLQRSVPQEMPLPSSYIAPHYEVLEDAPPRELQLAAIPVATAEFFLSPGITPEERAYHAQRLLNEAMQCVEALGCRVSPAPSGGRRQRSSEPAHSTLQLDSTTEPNLSEIVAKLVTLGADASSLAKRVTIEMEHAPSAAEQLLKRYGWAK